jgi:hypothetical protein
VLEQKVIAALTALGVEGMRAELPFENASIWAPSDSGELFVNAIPVSSDNAEFVVVSHESVGDIEVERGHYADDVRDVMRFACDDIVYYVDGDPPADFSDISAFVAELIPALGC